MRDPKTTTNRVRTKRSLLFRSTRRKALAAALLLSSPMVIADQPEPTNALKMPPLPVHEVDVQQVANHEVYDNPFCEPELQPIRQGKVKQASSEIRSAVRLKDAGRVIGLRPISGDMPINVRPPALKIEAPSVSAVQENPMIRSEHRENSNLVDVSLPANPSNSELLTLPEPAPVPVADQKEAIDSVESIQNVMMPIVPTEPVVVAAPTHRSILVKPGANSTEARVVPAKPMELAPKAAPAEVANQGPVQRAIVSTPAAAPLAAEPPAAATNAPVQIAPAPMAPAPQVAVDQVEAKPSPNPVYFSMSDSSTSKSAVTEKVDQQDNERSIQSPSDIAPNIVKPVVIAKRDGALSDPVVAIAPDMTDALDSSDAPVKAERQKLAVSSDAVAIPKPIVARTVSSKSRDGKALLSTHKRYRAPVAVDAPPVAITNSGPQLLTESAAMARDAVKIAKPVNVSQQTKQSNSNELTKLHLTRAQVRSLTIGGMVRRVNVVNKNVCQAITAGPNQLKLIGTGNGVTRLVVWADTAGNSKTRARAFEVHVQDAVETTGGSVGDKTQMLNRSIYNAFPTSNISVQEYRDRLIVSGECDTEEEAKKIIRMVRKTCLIPVRDEIKVR